MKTHKFARKTFYVDAVRVSEANIDEVAEWCGGVVQDDATGHKFIKVEVVRALNDRQSQAFVGDWVLYSGSSYKVYTPKAFDKSFDKVKFLNKEQADAAGIVPPHEPRTDAKPVHGNKEEGITPKRPVPTAPKRRPRKPANPVLNAEAAAKLKDATVTSTGKVIDEEAKVVAEVDAPLVVKSKTPSVLIEGPTPEPKSRADLEAEAKIAEIQALRER